MWIAAAEFGTLFTLCILTLDDNSKLNANWIDVRKKRKHIARVIYPLRRTTKPFFTPFIYATAKTQCQPHIYVLSSSFSVCIIIDAYNKSIFLFESYHGTKIASLTKWGFHYCHSILFSLTRYNRIQLSMVYLHCIINWLLFPPFSNFRRTNFANRRKKKKLIKPTQ